ncbi:carbon storage regulator [Enterococcus cecorum]|nr:carbon storage regulator [Enterococcus cecorum]
MNDSFNEYYKEKFMLRLVLKKGEQVKIGEDIVIKSMNDSRVNLAIDAPNDVKIERIKSVTDVEEKNSRYK